MADHEHEALAEPHERLRWARVRWQLQKGIKPEMGAAADSLGMQQATYRAYEREPGSSKHTPLGHQQAMRFGRKFGVSWQWLLTGDGSPDTADLSEVEWRVVRALREAPEARQSAVAEAIEQLLKVG